MVPQLAEMDQNYQILELQTGGTACSLLTGCLNAFTSLCSLLDFLSGSFSVGSSSNLKF